MDTHCFDGVYKALNLFLECFLYASDLLVMLVSAFVSLSCPSRRLGCFKLCDHSSNWRYFLLFNLNMAVFCVYN